MMQLLVVEDSRAVRSFLQHHLSPWFELELAEDGEQGLQMARARRYDLVLSDINLPHRNGFQLFTALRDERPDQRIVLMTDGDIDAYLPDACAAGVGNILAKASFKIDFDGVIRLLRDLERPAMFGMAHRLGTGGEVRTFVVSCEQEIPEAIKQCQALLDRFPRRDVYRRLLPELIRNALVHGRPSQQRAGDGCEYIHLSVGADWHKVGLGVRDPGGNLPVRRVLEWLAAHIGQEPDVSGTGQGLMISRRLMDQTMITVAPGRETEILCFDLLQGYRGPKSLMINEVAG